MHRTCTPAALVLGTVLGMIAFLASGSAAAQERQGEISAGWSYAHQGGVSIPAGWFASGAGYVNGWFGVAGEASGHYKTITEEGVDIQRDFHLFTVGPRVASRKLPRVTAFVDLLVGGRHGRPAGNGPGANANTSTTDFAYQSQFGIVINDDSGRFGLRVSAGDYGIRSQKKWTNDSLVEIGVVVRP
jgi:hypothetical protein